MLWVAAGRGASELPRRRLRQCAASRSYPR
jgi:hypothetical protein